MTEPTVAFRNGDYVLQSDESWTISDAFDAAAANETQVFGLDIDWYMEFYRDVSQPAEDGARVVEDVEVALLRADLRTVEATYLAQGYRLIESDVVAGLFEFAQEGGGDPDVAAAHMVAVGDAVLSVSSETLAADDLIEWTLGLEPAGGGEWQAAGGVIEVR